MLGDNGVILRELQSPLLVGSDPWKRHPAPFADVVRQVSRFDDIDTVSGNDTLLGQGGDDVISGQRGDDRLSGGWGDDELIGHLGDDSIFGGDGSDVIIADVGRIVRAFHWDGAPVTKADGAWHRDVLLEEVGDVIDSVNIGSELSGEAISALAGQMIDADRMILTGTYAGDGGKSLVGDAWHTEILFVDLLPFGNDYVDGGDGADMIFGQQGDDELHGGGGADLITGDAVNILTPFQPDGPLVRTGVRLLGGGDLINVDLGAAGTLIAPRAIFNPEDGAVLDGGFAFVPEIVQATFGSHLTDRLTRGDGSAVVPFASMTSDMLHHADVLSGNDTIFGDGGNDLIIADALTARTPSITPFVDLEWAIDQVTASVAAVVHELKYLSLDFALAGKLDGTSVLEHDIRIGNDEIDGGDGDDFILSDDGVWFVANNFVDEGVRWRSIRSNCIRSCVTWKSCWLISDCKCSGPMLRSWTDCWQTPCVKIPA